MRLDFNRSTTHHETKSSSHSSSIARKMIWWTGAFVALCCLGIIGVLSLGSGPTYSHGVMIFDSYSTDSLQSSAKLLWIQPEKKMYTVVQFPPELEFSSRRLGFYPLRSVATAYTTHHQKDLNAGADLSSFFRLPIQGFIVGKMTISDDPIQLARFVFTGCLHASHTLTLSSCIGLARSLLSPGLSLRTASAPASILRTNETTEARPLNREAYRSWSQKIFAGQPGLLSHFTVSVINASEMSGVAKSVAQVLEDFGFSIVQTTQAKTVQERGELILSKKVSDSTEIRSLLQDIFKVPVKVDDERVRSERSDMVILLGKEEAKFFGQ